ncbi:MAG TPA: hypothetical protein VM198_05010 [Longimicrobiales bacterium]|nr:hypothetical protein [Longimicrobiales bacterium]
MEAALERLRRTLVGYSQDELCSFLEDAGYIFDREARHGKFYRHPKLASEHPDVATRQRYAYVLVQKGRDLKPGAASNVKGALEFLDAWEKSHDK